MPGRQPVPRDQETSQASNVLVPKLLFQFATPDVINSTSIRDFTVTDAGEILTFDYEKYVIKKYDGEGTLVFSFGGSGDGEAQFRHLTGIHAAADKILAVDSIALFVFDTNGRLLEKKPFAEEVLTDHPSIAADGRFVGREIRADEIRMVLTYRSPDGEEIDRLAFYDIREFFPEIEPGEDFFLNDEFARSYHYAFTPEGNVVWAASDAYTVYLHRKGTSEPMIREDATPLPFPPDVRESMAVRKSRLTPPLHMYVPETYQIIHRLICGADGDIWVYVLSRERTGFLRYSGDGRLLGAFEIQADFSFMRTDNAIHIFGNRMYFAVNNRGSADIYVVDLPEVSHSR